MRGRPSGRGHVGAGHRGRTSGSASASRGSHRGDLAEVTSFASRSMRRRCEQSGDAEERRGFLVAPHHRLGVSRGYARSSMRTLAVRAHTSSRSEVASPSEVAAAYCGTHPRPSATPPLGLHRYIAIAAHSTTNDDASTRCRVMVLSVRSPLRRRMPGRTCRTGRNQGTDAIRRGGSGCRAVAVVELDDRHTRHRRLRAARTAGGCAAALRGAVRDQRIGRSSIVSTRSRGKIGGAPDRAKTARGKRRCIRVLTGRSRHVTRHHTAGGRFQLRDAGSKNGRSCGDHR